MRTLLLALLFGGTLALSSCSKHQCTCDGETLTLTDRTGLDGCSWVFEDANGQLLEPINLGDFQVPLFEGNVFSVQYKERSDLGSICMVGPMIEIHCIEQLAVSESP
jgi:hypothetical protein